MIGVLAASTAACEPTVIVGARVCRQSPTPEGGATPNPDSGVDLPWSTGFEDGFCGYAAPMGFCYGAGSSAYALVTAPVHSGRYAAAFSVVADSDAGSQVRCVQQGIFPQAAYYGAWYYVPAPAVNTGLWNLFHFQGGPPNQRLHGLWDVSLVNEGDAGALRISFFDFLSGTSPDASAAPPIPIAQWFHLEVYFKRAKDATGELSVWQDDRQVLSLGGLATDDTDWGQWYVGNLATALAPTGSTVYIDDVSIRANP
jgi:hypothetical protein